MECYLREKKEAILEDRKNEREGELNIVDMNQDDQRSSLQ
jgi:hypothetical protein